MMVVVVVDVGSFDLEFVLFPFSESVVILAGVSSVIINSGMWIRRYSNKGYVL